MGVVHILDSTTKLPDCCVTNVIKTSRMETARRVRMRLACFRRCFVENSQNTPLVKNILRC